MIRPPMTPPAEAPREVHPDVRAVGWQISDHLCAIAELFKPGVKLTLLARRAEKPDGSQDIVLTDDDLTAVIAALTIRKEQGPS